MNKILLCGFLSLCLLMSFGCASKRSKKPEINEVFKTHIDEQEIKMFSYSMSIERKQRQSSGSGGKKERGGGGRGGGGRGGKGGEGGGGRGGENGRSSKNPDNSGEDDRESRFKRLLDENLNKQLEKTAYCRTGHLIIDEDIRDRSALINGKCVEIASEKDRLDFPNEESLPSVVPEEDLSETYKL